MSTPGWNMRAMGESDRSPEFILSREALVNDVNSLLEQIRVFRDGGTTMPDGSEIYDEPRITTTELGRTSVRGVVSKVEEHKRGVSLTGDGVTTPLRFESITPDLLQGGREVVRIIGSDPLGVAVNGGVYDHSRQQETVASFKLSHFNADDIEESYFRYTIRGDGALQHAYVDEKGWNHATTVRDIEDAEMAREAFGLVRGQIFPEN